MVERTTPILVRVSAMARYLPLCMAWCAACHASAAEAEVLAKQFAGWGDDTVATIECDLFLANRGLYAEQGAIGERRPTTPAYNWGAGVQLSALAAAAQVDPQRYANRLVRYTDALQQHWGVQRGIGGYDVLPRERSVDRYYDDNAWMVLALVEVYEVTGQQRFLDRAKQAMQFVLSGEDNRLGGGIYWRENEKTSKNTCSNAPSAVAALRLYEHTNSDRYLETAKRLYQWTRRHLQDDDGLYWDNIDLSGQVDRRKYTYNTALMIRAACLLHKATDDPAYLEEAQRVTHAACGHWIRDRTGGIRDAGRFAHMLLEAVAAVWRLDRNPDRLETIRRSVEFVHKEVRDANDRYPKHWARPTRGPVERYALIDQASAARAYFAAAGTFDEAVAASD